MKFTIIVIILAALTLASYSWASVRGARAVFFVTIINLIVFGIIFWVFAQYLS